MTISQARISALLITLIFVTPANAEVVTAAPDHYTLRQEAISPLPPDQIWQRLIHPADWWHPDHSFSGNSENLSLDTSAGGLWLEKWDGGSVAHGHVLYAKENEQLRLDAPFGPLQELGVKVIWTITILSDKDGSKIVFDEIANGTSASRLDDLAPAVDFVKTEAINRLVNH